MNTGTEAVLIASVRLTLPFVCFFFFLSRLSFHLYFICLCVLVSFIIACTV